MVSRGCWGLEQELSRAADWDRQHAGVHFGSAVGWGRCHYWQNQSAADVQVGLERPGIGDTLFWPSKNIEH